MLVLTRKVGRSILIGNDIKVTILGMDSTQVKIGIDAPKDINVLRDELRDRLEADGVEVKMEGKGK